jgi:hypothetical protein
MVVCFASDAYRSMSFAALQMQGPFAKVARVIWNPHLSNPPG